MNAIQAFVPTEVVQTIAAFLEFCYIARRNVITEDSLDQLNAALRKFHKSRQIFSGTVRANGLEGFSLPRQHAMTHYYNHIKNFGSPNGLCSSITESKHITAVKRPWRRSNKHKALQQMLKSNERLDKIAAARTDFQARGMLEGSCLAQAIKDTLATEDSMDEDAGDSDETSSESSTNDTETQADDTDDSTESPVDDTDDDTGNPVDDGDDDTGNPVDNNDDASDYSVNDTGVTGERSANDNQATPPDNGDDDCGPVETGPLMNEVRLVARKG